jgi:hypothetical protein
VLRVGGLTLAVAGYAGLAWVQSGSDLAGVGLWLLTIALGVLLPGVVLVRVWRPRPAAAVSDLVSDLAWGSVAGLVLALVTWFVGRLLDRHLDQVAVGLGVGLVAVLVPAARRRLLARGGERLGWPVGLAVTAGALLVVRCASTTGLSWVHPHIQNDSPRLSPDLLFHVALTGELRRTFTPEYPMVAGTSLNYHWFYYALAAQLGGDGSRDIDVTLRLLPLTLMCLLVLVAAAVAVVVSRRRAAGVAAALLVAAVAPVGTSLWQGARPFPSLTNPAMLWPTQTYWLWSPTQTLAWVIGLAAMGLTVALARWNPPDRGEPLWLLVPTVVVSAGAKSIQNPLLLAFLLGVGLHALTSLRRHAPAAHGWRLARVTALGVGTGVVTLAMAQWLYPQSYGMRFAPGESIGYLVSAITPALAQPLLPDASLSPFAVSTDSAVAAVALRLGPTLLATVGVLGLFRRRATRAAGWGALTLAAGAVAGHLLFSHPGRSEWFFVIGAAPLLMTLAGAGAGPAIADWLGSRSLRLERAVPLLVAAATGLALTVVVTRQSGRLDPRQQWQRVYGHPATTAEVPPAAQLQAWLGPWLWLLGGVALAAVAALLVGLLWHPRGRARPALVVAVTTLAVAAAGALPTWHLVRPGADPYPAAVRARAMKEDTAKGVVVVTPALERAGDYLREHAGADDVVATNRVYIVPQRAGGSGGDNRDFSVSALSGLRTEVGGFAYAGPATDMASRQYVNFMNVPFWDPVRLQAELSLIRDPAPSRLEAAWQGGVRWIVTDRRAGAVSPDLGLWCSRVFSEDGVDVYRLPPGGA